MSYIQQWREDRKHPIAHPAPQYPTGSIPNSLPTLASQPVNPLPSQPFLPNSNLDVNMGVPVSVPLAGPSTSRTVPNVNSNHAQNLKGAKGKIGRPRKNEDVKPTHAATKKFKNFVNDTPSPVPGNSKIPKVPKMTKKQRQAAEQAAAVHSNPSIPVVTNPLTLLPPSSSPNFSLPGTLPLQPLGLMGLPSVAPPSQELAVGVGLSNFMPGLGLPNQGWTNQWS